MKIYHSREWYEAYMAGLRTAAEFASTEARDYKNHIERIKEAEHIVELIQGAITMAEEELNWTIQRRDMLIASILDWREDEFTREQLERMSLRELEQIYHKER